MNKIVGFMLGILFLTTLLTQVYEIQCKEKAHEQKLQKAHLLEKEALTFELEFYYLFQKKLGEEVVLGIREGAIEMKALKSLALYDKKGKQLEESFHNNLPKEIDVRQNGWVAFTKKSDGGYHGKLVSLMHSRRGEIIGYIVAEYELETTKKERFHGVIEKEGSVNPRKWFASKLNFTDDFLMVSARK